MKGVVLKGTDPNVVKENVGWVSGSVTQQVFEKWWITLALIHPTKDKSS